MKKLLALLQINLKPLTVILVFGIVGWLFGGFKMGLAIGLAFCSAMTILFLNEIS